MSGKLKVAVLLENHPYDVVNFQKMFESFEDCECYIQPLHLFNQNDDDNDQNRKNYDTVIYYNMNIDIPKEGSALAKYMTDEVGASKQGIIVMHHGLLNFKGWDLFTDVCGLKNRGEGGIFKYTQNQKVEGKVINAAHPTMAGIDKLSIIDETYILGEPEESGNEILMTTDNETSIKNIAWVRQYKQSRVFCTASGHNNLAYSDLTYRKMLHNAILWTSGKI